MGFAVYYRSTEPVTIPNAAAVIADAEQMAAGRTWLSCEPLILTHHTDAHLEGGSKPTFKPAAIDVEAAQQEGLPDGTVADLVEMLCRLSRDHGIYWEFSHDYGDVGQIRNGVAEESITMCLDGLAAMSEMIAEFDDNGPEDVGSIDASPDDENDEPPDIIRFPGS